MTELTLKEVEVTKLNLNPGDVLTITIKSDDVDQYSLNSFRDVVKTAFPSNRVILLSVGLDDSVNFTVVADPNVEASGCSTSSFCSDCSCGKKEMYESEQEKK